MPTVMPAAGLPLMVTFPETVASAVLVSVLVCEFARCGRQATATKTAKIIKARQGSFITLRGVGAAIILKSVPFVLLFAAKLDFPLSIGCASFVRTGLRG